ncbi:MFS transporter [Georgenia alba]|uniref:MFS transporter n=1 Tax=Georgenia alba TaxID=2233858 RepID=A0ABW2Q5I6_9MICO
MSRSCRTQQRHQQSVVSPARRDLGALRVLLAVTFLAFVNYAALLGVVPMWVSAGGAGSLFVGLTTAVMMTATVLTQVSAPWLFRLLSLRSMMIAGTILLGAPAPLYLLSPDVGWVLGVTVPRGIGFALVVMAGATLVASLAGEGRLSSSASLYGAAAALPNLAALAGGVWAAEGWGFAVVFWVSACSALLAGVLAAALPAALRGTFTVAALRDAGSALTPIGLFLTTAAAFGAASTFLPVASPGAGAASLALLGASVALLVGRLAAGFLGDRLRSDRLLLPTVVMAGAGMGTIGLALRYESTGVLIVGAAVLGAGFGACQNASFVTAVDRLGATRTAVASTVWNAAYDGGIGLGAVVIGWVTGLLGYPGAFLGMAVTIVAGALTFRAAVRLQPR